MSLFLGLHELQVVDDEQPHPRPVGILLGAREQFVDVEVARIHYERGSFNPRPGLSPRCELH